MRVSLRAYISHHAFSFLHDKRGGRCKLSTYIAYSITTPSLSLSLFLPVYIVPILVLHVSSVLGSISSTAEAVGVDAQAVVYACSSTASN